VAHGKILLGDANGVHEIDARRGRVGPPLSNSSAADVAASAGAAQGLPGQALFTDGWGNLLTVDTALEPPVVSVLPQPGGPVGVAAGGGLNWVTLSRLNQVQPHEIGERQTGRQTTRVAGEPIGAVFARGAVWVASARSGAITRIAPATARPGQPHRIGPRLGGIAFGAGLLWVTVQSASAAAGADGTILFATDRGLSLPGFADIRASGGPIRSAKAGAGIMPSASPDGRRIVYATRTGVLETAILDTGRGHRLGQLRGWAPRWSRDGSRIAYWRVIGRRSELVVTDPAGRSPTVLAGWPGRADQLARLDWSPSGNALVVQEPASGHLDIVDAATGAVTPLTIFPASSPRWSPDGSHVAYFARVDGPGIYVSGRDGQTSLVVATPNVFDWVYGSAVLTWSPDGRRLAYAGFSAFNGGGSISGEDIWVAYADGSGATRLTDTGGTGATMPEWLPHT
jgi:hypothetical protein